MAGIYNKPRSRLEDPQFLKDLLNTIAIEFDAVLDQPEWQRQVPDRKKIIDDVRAGRQIMYRSWLDSVITNISKGYILSDEETRQLRNRIFKLAE